MRHIVSLIRRLIFKIKRHKEMPELLRMAAYFDSIDISNEDKER